MRSATLAVTLLVSTAALADHPYRKGAVAAAQAEAAAAGRQMLEQGGNAVDAAVAAALVMGVVAPYHSGLGGGGFAVVHTAKDQKTRVLDFREVAPKGASRDMFLKDGALVPGASLDGALAVAVPGAIAGYVELQAKYGVLPRKAVFAPAIFHAKKGMWATPQFVRNATTRRDCLAKDSEAAELFLRKDASGAWQPPKVGEQIPQTQLGATLSEIAFAGSAAVLKGRIGKAIADTVQSKGGVLTQDDLTRFTPRWREPLVGSYRGHVVATMPPPSAGGITVLQVLGALEKFGPKGLASRDVPTLHVFIEALRRSYVDRYRFLGDPAFVEVPVKQLVSPEWVDATLAAVNPKHAGDSQALLKGAAPPRPEGTHTTHISAIDAQGNAVAMTTTINYLFGSCVVAKGTGILLNDEMDDFAAAPGSSNEYGLLASEANAVAPGKVPLSSMSPTLVFDGDGKNVLLAVGAPGGSTIPTTVIQVVSNVVDAQMSAQRAVGFGRLHHQWLPDVVRTDAQALEPETQKALEALGHVVKASPPWGDPQAVVRDPVTGLFSAGSDPRYEGQGAGLD
ncbi:MAG: gamma-glutamyltransferase [Myxococcaceae bacterium]|nr:gamma-glutamyltransferase [Myxococcaceae bacterium]